MLAYATDELVIDRKLIDTLCEATDDPGLLQYLLTAQIVPAYGSPQDVGCIHFRNEGSPRERDIAVTLKHGAGKARISVCRVAFAAARINWSRGLSRKENIAHTCGSEHRENGKRMPCINPGHIVRESEVDKTSPVWWNSADTTVLEAVAN